MEINTNMQCKFVLKVIYLSWNILRHFVCSRNYFTREREQFYMLWVFLKDSSVCWWIWILLGLCLFSIAISSANWKYLSAFSILSGSDAEWATAIIDVLSVNSIARILKVCFIVFSNYGEWIALVSFYLSSNNATGLIWIWYFVDVLLMLLNFKELAKF